MRIVSKFKFSGTTDKCHLWGECHYPKGLCSFTMFDKPILFFEPLCFMGGMGLWTVPDPSRDCCYSLKKMFSILTHFSELLISSSQSLELLI